MTDKERKEFVKILEGYKDKFSKNEKAAKDFFVKAGIYTPTGRLTKKYKN